MPQILCQFCQKSHIRGLHVTICLLKQAAAGCTVSFKATVLQCSSLNSTPTNSIFRLIQSWPDTGQHPSIYMSQDFRYFNLEIGPHQIIQTKLVSNCTLCGWSIPRGPICQVWQDRTFEATRSNQPVEQHRCRMATPGKYTVLSINTKVVIPQEVAKACSQERRLPKRMA